MNFWEIIFVLFAILSFILAFYFFLKKEGDGIANILLGSYLLLFSFNLIYNVLYWSQLLFSLKYIYLFGVLIIIWLLYPPLIYSYIRRVLHNHKFKLFDLIHLIPVIIGISLYSRVYLLDSSSKLNVLRDGLIVDYIYFAKYATLLVSLVMIFYSILIYKSFTNNNFLGYNKTLWLKWVIGSFFGYVLAMVTYFTLSYFQLITTEHDYVIMYTIVFFVGLVAYFGLMQPDVFDGLSMRKILPFKKYQKTGLSENIAIELKSKLIDLMENEKPYLNSDIRLNDLAEKLNLSRHHVSQVINEHFDSSFYFFINKYRINEAKKMLDHNTNLNINDIIYQSGFNNRVSFYKAFKALTGITPTDYRNIIKKK